MVTWRQRHGDSDGDGDDDGERLRNELYSEIIVEGELATAIW